MAATPTKYRVQQWTNNSTQVNWFILQVSVDGGVTWNTATNVDGSLAASTAQATMVALMNSYHAAQVGDIGTPSNWTIGPVVAGPL